MPGRGLLRGIESIKFIDFEKEVENVLIDDFAKRGKGEESP